MHLNRRFLEALRRLNIRPGDQCLVALSGGGDSMALLDLLDRCFPDNTIHITAARVVHRLRNNTIENQENSLCRLQCEGRNIPFTVLQTKPEEVVNQARALGCGIEQAARNCRYRLLERHRIAVGADYIFFGHTADDQIETVLMRLLSGSGPEGLRGIPSQRGSIRRPLLGFPREELRGHLVSHGVPWIEDQSNDEGIYRRNRVRNELIPLFNDIFPGWASSLTSLAQRSDETAWILNDLLDRSLPGCFNEITYSWEQQDWDLAPDYLKAMAIWKGLSLVNKPSIPDHRISWSTVKAIREALDEGREWESQGCRFGRIGHRIEVTRMNKHLEGRLIFNKRDVEQGGEFQVGTYMIRLSGVNFQGAEGVLVDYRCEPMELCFQFDGSGWKKSVHPITEKLSAESFNDTDKEILYISIKDSEVPQDA